MVSDANSVLWIHNYTMLALGNIFHLQWLNSQGRLLNLHFFFFSTMMCPQFLYTPYFKLDGLVFLRYKMYCTSLARFSLPLCKNAMPGLLYIIFNYSRPLYTVGKNTYLCLLLGLHDYQCSYFNLVICIKPRWMMMWLMIVHACNCVCGHACSHELYHASHFSCSCLPSQWYSIQVTNTFSQLIPAASDKVPPPCISDFDCSLLINLSAGALYVQLQQTALKRWICVECLPHWNRKKYVRLCVCSHWSNPIMLPRDSNLIAPTNCYYFSYFPLPFPWPRRSLGSANGSFSHHPLPIGPIVDWVKELVNIDVIQPHLAK